MSEDVASDYAQLRRGAGSLNVTFAALNNLHFPADVFFGPYISLKPFTDA
jgi:hypothetical protein